MVYEQTVVNELHAWQHRMVSKPSLLNALSKRLQTKINSYIPEKVHKAVTTVIKQMVRGVLFGAGYTVPKKPSFSSFEETEDAVQKRIRFYKHTASVEGGLTGAGGLLWGLADFPLLLSLKLKLLFDVATLYGHSVSDYKERVFILHIFQLAFSSQQHRSEVYAQMVNWNEKKGALPDAIHQFDWRGFQQEYRDYIDLAKLAQLIPGIGAVVGFVVNARLIKKLGITAMNAYRMRWAEEREAQGVPAG